MVVIGAGVVGLAIATKLQQQFSHVLLIDKNNNFGEETSSRNSEVIHAGIYYPENSIKAKLCVEGKERLYAFCQQHNVPHHRLGKLIVSHSDDECEALNKIKQQAEINGVVDLQWKSQAQVNQLEPNVSAKQALFSPSTGIIDVNSYMAALVHKFQQQGGLFVAQTEAQKVAKIQSGFCLTLNSVGETTTIESEIVINSAGLHSTTVAENIADLAKIHIPQIHYCRGHYFSYSGKSPLNHLVYPIPNTHGLGIHASLDVGGQLKFGPDTQFIDEIDYTVDEALKEKFYRAIRQYFPTIDKTKLQPAYSGIRPKLQAPNQAVQDFHIQTEKQHQIKGLVNLFGIESPGLTSSLAIAEQVALAL